MQTLTNIFSRPLNGKGAILCFHRVLPANEIAVQKGPNAIGLTYSIQQFDTLLKWLTTKYKVISLDAFAEHMISNSGDFAIALTFDDGYKDNLVYALPLLEKYNSPATIYVTTGFIENDACIWWFELWEHIEKVLSLTFYHLTKKYYFITDQQADKEQCFLFIKKLFLSIPNKNHKELLSNITGQPSRSTYTELFLSRKEIVKLDKNPLITIGAHTINHENLAILTKQEVAVELCESKAFLTKLLGHSIKHFAYPYGNSGEAGSREYGLVAKTGYQTAVTLRTEIMGGNNKMALSRIPVLQSSGIKEIAFAIDKYRRRGAYANAFLAYGISFIKNRLRKS